MKELLIWFCVLVGMILFAAWLQTGGLKLRTDQPTVSMADTKSMKVGEKTINVEIATTEDEHKKGLSGRDSLSADSGMLFVMKKDSVPSFWMKDMKFPIDIIWINDNEVVDVAESIPPAEVGAVSNDIPRYKSQKPIDYVLEVNSGFIKDNGIKIGDKVEFPDGIE